MDERTALISFIRVINTVLAAVAAVSLGDAVSPCKTFPISDGTWDGGRGYDGM